MATFFTELDEKLKRFIEHQGIFLVATAPEAGRINLSPKGMDCLQGGRGMGRTLILLRNSDGCQADCCAEDRYNPDIVRVRGSKIRIRRTKRDASEIF